MPKTIFRQIDELFSMCKSFKRRRKGVPKHLITSAATFNIYRDACMRFAKDLAERRGTKKFQIVSITPKEVQNFLERIKIVYRPETAHQYASALQKLQHMINKKYCKKGREIDWKIKEFNRPRRTREDVTVQRGPAYTEKEADVLIREMAKIDKKAADALVFIKITGCRAESIFGRLKKTGGRIVKDGKLIKEQKTEHDFTKAVTPNRIDLESKFVRLYEKNGRYRVVRYDEKYQAFMERLVEKSSNPEAPIFAGIKQQTMYKRIKRIAENNGFDVRGLHGMRKTFAVSRLKNYIQEIKELIKNKNWQKLVRKFPVSKQKAKRMCRQYPYSKERVNKTVEKIARLRLSQDLGHNRIEVTYRYVPKD
ncbi:hypothetical protein M1N04_01040 [Peptococcaceae bacterium]|nr:hypothetical protein [Peptococcaceae bacterium]